MGSIDQARLDQVVAGAADEAIAAIHETVADAYGEHGDGRAFDPAAFLAFEAAAFLSVAAALLGEDPQRLRDLGLGPKEGRQ